MGASDQKDSGTTGASRKKFEIQKVGIPKKFLEKELLNSEFDLGRKLSYTAHPRCFPTTLFSALTKKAAHPTPHRLQCVQSWLFLTNPVCYYPQ